MERHWVYILRCSDGSLYTGYTTDTSRRLAEHNGGHASKYTRGRRPVTLAYQESLGTKSAALRREAAIKRLSRTAKEGLLRSEGEYSSR